VAVARAADDDEWRNQVRDALVQGQSETLKQLAASPRIDVHPLQTLSLLGEALQDADASVAVLQQAQRKYPHDFWINFQLAWSLERMQPPRVEESIRYYSVAKALRPRNAPVHLFLGNMLRQGGRLDDAIIEYRKALELQPSYPVAHHNLANVLWAQG